MVPETLAQRSGGTGKPCRAHQGPPKSAQRHKVLADAFKLAWTSSTLYPRPDPSCA
jgi:hypothetical protein